MKIGDIPQKERKKVNSSVKICLTEGELKDGRRKKLESIEICIQILLLVASKQVELNNLN